jgi:hypothetical protein
MRGLGTAFPRVRPGRSLSYCGRRLAPATKRLMGVPLPQPRPRLCASYGPVAVSATGNGHAGCASRPTDHMKPTSSRAMAVQTMVVFLPLALSAR